MFSALGPPLFTAATVAAGDQAIKAWVTGALGPGSGRQTLEVCGPLVVLDYVENRGAAFGVLQGSGTALAVVAFAVLGGLIWFCLRQPAGARAGGIPVGLIMGGAIGNLVDRLRLGYVVDFVAIGWWPRFNLADAAITIGIVWLAVQSLWGAGLVAGGSAEGDRSAVDG